jgi:GWxTD domain-containing protein
MKRPVLFLAVLILASAALADTIPTLFQKTKDQVKSGSWQDALSTMSTLEAEASRPGNENVRKQLQAPLAFYRGVCQANLGQTAEAKSSFQTFLADQPNAAMDPAMYSKRAVAAFEDARRSTAVPVEKAASGTPSLFNSFQEFKAPPNSSDPPDERWGDGPVRWIMTAEEKKTWASLSAGADRAEFVEKFWESRNPNPGSPDNVVETSFERRVAFADARFVQDEAKRGSMTDRGMVFVVLGPPTYGGRRPIKNGEDTSEAAGMSTVSSAQVQMAQASAMAGSPTGKISSGQAASIADAMTGPGTQAAESNNNYQEVWHYRKELLPKGVGYQQVDVVFITRKGYGANVLQRDPATLTTLAAGKPKPAS